MSGDDRTRADDDWDDVRLAGAYRDLAGRASSIGVSDAVAVAIRVSTGQAPEVDPATAGARPVLEEVTGTTRRIARPAPGSRPRPRRTWFAIAAALAVVAVGLRFAIMAPAPAAGPGGLHHFHAEGIDFDYPSTWAIHDQLPSSSGFGQTWAIIGTQPWPSSCGPSDLNCYYEAKLEPGTIAVDVGVSYMPSTDVDLCSRAASGSDVQGRGPDDPVATQTAIRVDGRPTLRTVYAVGGKDFYGSDEWLDWDIAPVGTVDEAYTIHARYRGPGAEAMKSELDTLIASIRLTPSQIATGSDPGADCGAPFPAAAPSPSGTAEAPSTPATGSSTPLPSGATPLALPAETGARYLCMQALLGPVRVVRSGDTVAFVSVDTGSDPGRLVWPQGYTARSLGGRAEIVAPDGSVVAREGDVLSLGGGNLDDGFHVCSIGSVTSPSAP